MNSKNERYAIFIDRLDTVIGGSYTVDQLAESWGAQLNETKNALLLPYGWTLKAYKNETTTKILIDDRGFSRGMLRDHVFMDRFTRRGRLYPLTRFRIREVEQGKFVMYDNALRRVMFVFAKGLGVGERVAWARVRCPNFESPFKNWDDPSLSSSPLIP